jgi:hypothetical protein
VPLPVVYFIISYLIFIPYCLAVLKGSLLSIFNGLCSNTVQLSLCAVDIFDMLRRMLLTLLVVASAAADATAETPCLLPPPKLKPGTVAGCTCVSDCGASVDDGYTDDWCYTALTCGTWSWTRQAYTDWCVYDPDKAYESQTAEAKEAFLWGLTAKCTTPAGWPSQVAIFQESVKTSFENVADVMPPGRTKYIHAVGAVATVAFVSSGVPHAYTGLFASGAQHGLLRLSTATAVDGGSGSYITPGLGLKLLRDGVPSGNLVAMPGLDGQQDYNVLSQNYSNHLTFPTSWALALVASKFTQASACPLMVALGDMAAYSEDGAGASRPIAPFELIFVPNAALKKVFPSQPYSNDDFLAFAELDIPQDTILFQVYAVASPLSLGPEVHLGSIKTTSKFTRSTFGDTRLFFRHEYMEHDFVKNPSWLPNINVPQACGSAHVDPNPPAHQGLGEGCPFAGRRGREGRGGGNGGCPFLAAKERQRQLGRLQMESGRRDEGAEREGEVFVA